MSHENYTHAINSRSEFIAFMRAFRRDLQDHSESWENPDLPGFLEAVEAWVDDMDGYYKNQGLPVPSQPDWSVLRDIFLAAKVYE